VDSFDVGSHRPQVAAGERVNSGSREKAMCAFRCGQIPSFMISAKLPRDGSGLTDGTDEVRRSSNRLDGFVPGRSTQAESPVYHSNPRATHNGPLLPHRLPEILGYEGRPLTGRHSLPLRKGASL